MAVERVLSNLNLISFKTEGGLQNHIDELQDGDLVFTPDNSLKGNLFDFKWTDHKLNDISWLNADMFSWQSGDVYVAAFEHLVNDYISLSTGVLYAYYAENAGETFYLYTDTPSIGDQLLDETGTPAYEAYGTHKVKEIYDDGSFARTSTFPGNRFYRDASKDITLSTPTSETETISGITIRYYKADDGHKICMQDQEANVQALYEKTGVAWYYIIDMINKRFKLPRTKFGFTGLRDSVGGYVEAGLPNITGSFTGILNHPDFKGSGSFASAEQAGSVNSGYATTGNYESKIQTTSFDASRSSSVYGNSNTIQPKATQMYLYFYVGNFEREAVEQTAGITSEQLNNKLDKSAETYLVPSGSVTAFAGTTAPTGWLKCDGSAISRTTYSALFAAIGTKYGAGDGSTTFNLPNLLGRVPFGMESQYIGQSTNGVLPNITGETSVADGYQNSIQYIRAVSASGAFYLSNRTMNCSKGAAAANNSTASPIMFNASRSSSIYGNGWFNGERVVPSSVGMTYCIKY